MNKVYLITDFGAIADSDELQTEKIQKAIDECFKNGGGTVIVPEGVYLTGGIRIRSNCTLYLKSGATLKGSRKPEDYFGYLSDMVEPLSESEVTNKTWKRTELDEVKDYEFFRKPGSRWNNALIKAVNAENVAIIGEENSFLDGSDCFDELGEENYRGPHCINMFNCKNVRLSGYSVILIISAIALTANDKKMPGKRIFALCVIIFFLNGISSVAAKMHQIEKTYFCITETEFVIATGVAKFIIAAIAYMVVKIGKKDKNADKCNKSGFAWGVFLIVLSTLLSGLSYILQLNGAKNLPATVLYPLITGGTIIFSSLTGIIFFKEQISKRLIFSIIICFAGTCMFL